MRGWVLLCRNWTVRHPVLRIGTATRESDLLAVCHQLVGNAADNRSRLANRMAALSLWLVDTTYNIYTQR